MVDATGGSAVPSIWRTYDPSRHRSFELTALLRRSKGFALLAGYCLGSGAANTLRQAAGICARVIGGFGFGGFFGGFGWSTESLNQ